MSRKSRGRGPRRAPYPAASYARPSQSSATFRSPSEESSNTNHRLAFMTVVWIRDSLRIRANMRGPASSNLNASEFGVSMRRVRGRIAKIRFLRYRAVNPNIGRPLTLGQSAISAPRVADQAFISSETAGRRGREACLRSMTSSVLSEVTRCPLRRMFFLATPHRSRCFSSHWHSMTPVSQFRISGINCSTSAFRSAVSGSSGSRTGPP
jgi:hypothetical protein